MGVGVCCAGAPVATGGRGQRRSLRCVWGGLERDAAQAQQRLSWGFGSSDSAVSVSFHPRPGDKSFMQES